jgi:hypothetical protein
MSRTRQHQDDLTVVSADIDAFIVVYAGMKYLVPGRLRGHADETLFRIPDFDLPYGRMAPSSDSPERFYPVYTVRPEPRQGRRSSERIVR